jgi:mercuric ion binding protein
MKKLFIISMVILASTGLKAQVMASKSQWITIKSANLKCWECKERLENYLKRENYANMENGLLQWKINLMSGEIRFQYNPDRVTPDEIRVAMNNAGFDADNEKAEEDAYKKLPPICKRAEDGGGPQKGKPCHMPPTP